MYTNQGSRVKKEKKFFRNCPSCDKQVGHVAAAGRDRCEGSLCRSCSNTKVKTGVPLPAETRAKMSAAKKGKKCSDVHCASMTAYKQSVKDTYTEMWGDKYNFPKHYFVKWSNAVKERDNYTCKKCAKVAEGKFINAHHIVPKEYFMARALDIDNGCTLCNGCHQKLHREVDKYTVAGVRFTATDFQNHLIGFITNGKK